MKTRYIKSIVLTCLVLANHPTVHAEVAGSAETEKPATTALEAKTLADIRGWGELKAGNGPLGRPLPLAASWAAGAGPYGLVFGNGKSIGDPVHDYFVIDPLHGPGPDRMIEEIKKGKHVMITFEDVVGAGGIHRPASRFEKDPGYVRFFDKYYRPALEYARTHKLPIAIRGWNWALTLVDVENGVPGRGRATQEQGPDDTAKLIRNGKVLNKVADPFGSIARWQEFGKIWMGHEVMRKIQEIYPNPPMVVFINNHEGGEITSASGIDDTCDRFVALYGKGKDLDFRAKKIREGYTERYEALFASARAAFVQPAWRENSLFIAYNNLGAQALTRGATSKTQWTGRINLDPESGLVEHRKYDGGTPEYYDNHWQAPAKSDASPWSPQVEASNLIAYQDSKVWAENPNFYWSSSLWGGDMPSNLFGRPGRYITDGAEPNAKWDLNRYSGMVQFGLWMLRPREYREFRGEDDLRGFYGAAWDVLVQSVDRVWNDATLTEFWKFGKLVHNPVFGERNHYFGSVPTMPAWLRDMDRWFLLTSDANPAESTWPVYNLLKKEHALKVFALALQLGESPKRRWLIYAHAPLGAVAGSSVELPGKGAVLLDYISTGGSFYLVDEATGKANALVRGGPAEIALESNARHIKPGSTIEVEASLRNPASAPFESYTWRVPGQADRTNATLGKQSFSFPNAGEYMITLEASTKAGEKTVGQMPVWVRPSPPAENAVVDMPLSGSYSDKGPWGTEMKSGKLLTFRYLPNASISFDHAPVLLGGQFVNDSNMGPVLEVNGADEGVIIPRSSSTIMDSQGHADLAIGFKFKAEDVQRLQQLYAQGWAERPGISIYLEGGQLHAGSWCMNKDKSLNFPGEWISTPVEAGKWYQVRFVMKDAEPAPRSGVATLYVDGKSVGSASAARLPQHYGNPRLSVAGLAMKSATKSGVLMGKENFFNGCFADFTFITGGPALAGDRNGTVKNLPLRAINIGGEKLRGSSGIIYEADSGGTGGSVQTILATLPVEAESDQDVYRSFRSGASFQYQFPLSNGDYSVLLKFIEPEHRSTPRRIDVSLQGKTVLKGLDVQAKVGVLKEHEVKLPARVTDGKLTLKFTGTAGEALLAGLVIEKASPSPQK